MSKTLEYIFLGFLVLVVIVGGAYVITHLSVSVTPKPGAATSTPGTGTSTQAGTTGTPSATPAGTPAPAVQNGTKTLALGESVTYDGLTATPVHILEDSRCPLGVMCIQAGTVRVAVKLTYLGFSTTQTFTLGQPVTLYGVTGELTKVDPVKTKDQTISPSDYRFTFSVSK